MSVRQQIKYKQSSIGGRLRQWGLSRYDSVGAFAKALGVSSEGLSPYLTGKRIPGNKVQRKLWELGADTMWIMFGESNGTSSRSPVSPVQTELLAYLDTIGIRSIREAKDMLDPERLAREVAAVLQKRLTKYKSRIREGRA